MAEIILTATPRPPQGTRPARRLRNEGKVPGVVYGMGAAPIPLSVEWRELRAALVTEQGLNAVIHLEVDGDRMPTLVKDMQSLYDVVIIDTPPAKDYADAQAIAFRAGNAIVVARKDHTPVGATSPLSRP